MFKFFRNLIARITPVIKRLWTKFCADVIAEVETAANRAIDDFIENGLRPALGGTAA